MYYQALAYATVVLWTSFPCVYVVSALQLISPELGTEADAAAFPSGPAIVSGSVH
jgi:hypothetical protein